MTTIRKSPDTLDQEDTHGQVSGLHYLYFEDLFKFQIVFFATALFGFLLDRAFLTCLNLHFFVYLLSTSQLALFRQKVKAG